MANIFDYIAFAETAASTCQNFDDLAVAVKNEFGARSKMNEFSARFVERWKEGNCPAKLQGVFDKIGNRPKSSTPAPKPAASAPVAKYALTAESIGKAVIATTTHPDPKINKPARAHLEGLTGLARAIAIHKAEAAAKATKKQPAAQMPDLSALSGIERTNVAREFEKTGVLSDRTKRLILLRQGKL